MADEDEEKVHVFICYAHADAHWLNRLRIHLAPLERNYKIDCWSDERIGIGAKWRAEIKEAIERASIAIILVSADFLASDFIAAHELPPLLRAAERNGTLIISIILSPCLFMLTELSEFQAVNDPKHSLVKMNLGDQEDCFVRAATTVLNRLTRPISSRTFQPSTERKQFVNVTPEKKTSEFTENFFDPSDSDRLLRWGDWIFDHDQGSIIGAGARSFLVSQREYGNAAFEIDTILEFTNFTLPKRGQLGMNAGVIFGWQLDAETPRYHNVLLTGTEVILERNGFKEENGKTWRHLSSPAPLPITAGKPVRLRVRVNDQIEVLADDKVLITADRPKGIVGRVGLRPMRSRMDCKQFVVIEGSQPRA